MEKCVALRPGASWVITFCIAASSLAFFRCSFTVLFKPNAWNTFVVPKKHLPVTF